MQLTVSEPIFLWIFGTIAGLIGVLLALLAVAFVYIILLLRLSHRKARELGDTLDVIQESIRETTVSFNDVRTHLVQFLNQSLNAVGVANLVGAVQTAWNRTRQAKKASKQRSAERLAVRRSSTKRKLS